MSLSDSPGREHAELIRRFEPGADAETLDRRGQLARRRLHRVEHRARGAPAGPRFELAKRIARFAGQQSGGAAAAAKADAVGLEQDDLVTGGRAGIRRHRAGHAAADDHDRMGDNAAKRRILTPFLCGNGIQPRGDAVTN